MTKNNNNFQRKDALSNTQVGADFEKIVFTFFQNKYTNLVRPYWLSIGYKKKKNHKFDLGCNEDEVIEEI